MKKQNKIHENTTRIDKTNKILRRNDFILGRKNEPRHRRLKKLRFQREWEYPKPIDGVQE